MVRYDARMTNAPDNLKELRRDLKRALTIKAEREPDYVRGREFYDGTRTEVAASKYVQKIVSDNAEAFPVSLAHIPVDVIVEMIELTSLSVTDASAAKLLAEIVKANHLDDAAEEWLLKAAYFGDYYVVVDPAEEDADTGAATPDGIKWIGSSPMTTIMVYDKGDDRQALYGAKVWQDGKLWRGRLFYDDMTVRLITEDRTDDPTAKAFDLDYDLAADETPDDAYIPHIGGRKLLHHLAIGGAPYGIALHRKAWGPQDAITKISATNLANVEATGLPARWALLDPIAELDDDIDADFGTDGPDTTSDKSDGQSGPTNGSKVRSVPGGISFLRGIKQVGTFESGDGNIFLGNMEWYIRIMAVACGIALFEFDLTGEQPSGESRRRAMGRSLKRAKRERRGFGSFLESIAETTLALLGKDGQIATATFYPIETSTDTEGLELIALKVKNGVPLRVALLEAGYTDVQVDEWWPEGAPAVTMETLGVLASALAQLGNATTLGAITPEEIRDMLPEILTGARNEATEEAPAAALEGVVVDPATQLKGKADAWSAFVRGGMAPEDAAEIVGLPAGLDFPNVPTTVRIPEADAAGLEGMPPAAPGAPVVE